MGLLRLHGFNDAVQHWHPACAQVAILEHDPRACPHPFVDHRFRPRALPLAQRDALDVLCSLRREFVQRLEGVRTRRQHEDQRRRARRIRVRPRQIKRRRRHKLLPQLLRHIIVHRRDQPVRPQAPQHQQALERRQGGDHLGALVRVRQHRHGGRGVVGRPPPGELVLDFFVDPGKGAADQGEAEQLRPRLRLDPVRGLGRGVLHGHSAGE
mmetsp:Transcript_68298/g.181900  ORF Transcript_68298/g.181900 Transcript_68298/m.181900 type:complete len:211 (+) Transcript_68298:1668-2300(+)